MNYQTYIDSLAILTREQYLAIALPTECDWHAYNRFLTPKEEWQWHTEACGVVPEYAYQRQRMPAAECWKVLQLMTVKQLSDLPFDPAKVSDEKLADWFDEQLNRVENLCDAAVESLNMQRLAS